MDYSQIRQDNKNLRPHQVEAKGKIFEAWNEYNAVMLQMPTGTGKTYLFTSLINDLIANYKAMHKEINILVVAHRMELLDQISATLTRFGITHGFIQGNREQHLWKRVQVGSIMSLLTDKNYYNVSRQRFDYIIVDEAHHSLADTYIKLFELFPEAKKLGVTATPWRLNHESFYRLYDILVTSPQISWFIQRKLLADFDYVSIRPDSQIQRLVDSSQVAQTGDFAIGDLENTFNNQRIRSKIYKSYEQYAKGRKGIIYAINKRHAANIAELYCKHHVEAVAIDCDTPKEERQDLIAQFKEGKIQVLVNVDIFTEGFDCPDVNFIQLARPTKSLALYLQQVGRGLRVVEGKEKTIIIDNVGLYNYFGLPDANRKWQYHFKGRDDVEHEEHTKRDGDLSDRLCFALDDDKFNEDDEQMMVVRGATQDIPVMKTVEPEKPKEEPIKEFSLCDYYLVRGTSKAFKIYPFVKKRGKATEAVGNCVYEYDEQKEKIVLTSQTHENESIIDQHIKLQSIISFAAMFAQTPMRSVINTNNLYSLLGKKREKQTSLFALFEMIDAFYKNVMRQQGKL